MSKPDDTPPGWTKQTVQLSNTHRWKASPGHGILVLDAGAMRLEYPSGWVVIPDDSTIAIHDRRPPDDECRVQITLMRLPPAQGGWTGLPLEDLFRQVTDHAARDSRRPREDVHQVTPIQRPDMQIVWSEHRWFDHEQSNRAVLCRHAMARAGNLQPFITFDYYEDRTGDLAPVWHHLIKTLRLGTPLSLQGDPLN